MLIFLDLLCWKYRENELLLNKQWKKTRKRSWKCHTTVLMTYLNNAYVRMRWLSKVIFPTILIINCFLSIIQRTAEMRFSEFSLMLSSHIQAKLKGFNSWLRGLDVAVGKCPIIFVRYLLIKSARKLQQIKKQAINIMPKRVQIALSVWFSTQYNEYRL